MHGFKLRAMMPNGRSYKASNMLLMRRDNCSSDTLEAMLVSCSPSVLQGSRSMAGLEEVVLGNVHKRQYYAAVETSEETGEDDMVDDSCVHQPEKKRRLTAEQVKFLEKSFEVENKLEPDRKLQLAKDLNLQPRQVAVWFQNRRARWKTKQLEKDYDALKVNYDTLKADYDTLLREKDQLQEEVSSLTTKLQENPNEGLNAPLKSDDTAKKDEKGGSEIPAPPLERHIKVEPVAEETSSDDKREASASSGSDESAVCDANSPHPIDSGPLKAEAIVYSRIPFVSTVDAPDMAIEAIMSGKVIPPQVYQQLVKTEEGLLEDEPCNYFFTLEEQGAAFPWWNWP